MPHLSLVPASLAAPGYRFTFLGPNRGEECQGCPFTKMCFDVEPGARYEVTAVRSVQHPCGLHDEGKVRVVEVQRVGFDTTMETKRLRGTAATFEPIPCGRPDCKNWSLCHPYGVQTGIRYGVEAAEDVPCPAGFKIKRVQATPL